MNIRWSFLPLLLVAGMALAQQGEKVWAPYDTVARVNRGTGQAPPNQEKFDVNKIFVGGSIGLGLGFGSQVSSWGVGAFPQVGYSLAEWVDAGIAFNLNFNSQKNYGDKFASFNYGAGAFLRAFPFKSVFLQAQPEINWIAYKATYAGYDPVKTTVSSPSMLVGIGYGQRIVGQSGFYTTLMFDVLNEKYSPYRNNDGTIFPILRAGFYVYLNRKGGRRAEDY